MNILLSLAVVLYNSDVFIVAIFVEIWTSYAYTFPQLCYICGFHKMTDSNAMPFNRIVSHS